MEGFRYLTVKESPYKVYDTKANKEVDTFPILPVGMLDLWRHDDSDPFAGLF